MDSQGSGALGVAVAAIGWVVAATGGIATAVVMNDLADRDDFGTISGIERWSSMSAPMLIMIGGMAVAALGHILSRLTRGTPIDMRDIIDASPSAGPEREHSYRQPAPVAPQPKHVPETPSPTAPPPPLAPSPPPVGLPDRPPASPAGFLGMDEDEQQEALDDGRTIIVGQGSPLTVAAGSIVSPAAPAEPATADDGPEPGWYPDPKGPGARYWDGRAWTDRTDRTDLK